MSTRHITHDMTQKFEAMQEQLVEKIGILSRTVGDLNETLAETEVRLSRVEGEKDAVIADRDAEIAALRAKMEDMATEFGSMLNGTLEKVGLIRLVAACLPLLLTPFCCRLSDARADRAVYDQQFRLGHGCSHEREIRVALIRPVLGHSRSKT